MCVCVCVGMLSEGFIVLNCVLFFSNRYVIRAIFLLQPNEFHHRGSKVALHCMGWDYNYCISLYINLLLYSIELSVLYCIIFHCITSYYI